MKIIKKFILVLLLGILFIYNATVITLAVSTINETYDDIISEINNYYNLSFKWCSDKKESIKISKIDFKKSLEQEATNIIKQKQETQKYLSEHENLEWSSLENTLSINYLDDNTSNSISKTITKYQELDYSDGYYTIQTHINVETDGTLWTYANLVDFSYEMYRSYDCYVPEFINYSISNDGRTISVILFCIYYDNNGLYLCERQQRCNDFSILGDGNSYLDYAAVGNYGSRDYTYCNDSGINCAGWAWDISSTINNVAMNITESELSAITSLQDYLNYIATKIEAYATTQGISWTRTTNYSSYVTDGYRIALRARWDNWNQNYEYHFMWQLPDGVWAEKQGSFPSNIVIDSGPISPYNFSWTRFTKPNTFYNSNIIVYERRTDAH